MNKKDVAIVIGIMSITSAIANIYILYNIMNEMDNMYAEIITIKQSSQNNREELMVIKDFWNLSHYDFQIIQTSKMEFNVRTVLNEEARARGEEGLFYNGDMAFFYVDLPLNSTYRIDIFSYSGEQTPLTRGSALEIIFDDESLGIFTFISEDWNWEFLCANQFYAGRHNIKIINREGGQLGDRNIIFKKVRIMWFN